METATCRTSTGTVNLIGGSQVRTRVLNEDWRSTLLRWYPGMEETCDAKAG